MFEHASLQELYTGSLIAGKGKKLNNIRVIMERTRLKTEDWARVRFGAGTPWRRCWCVIEPPDEKDFQKLQKTMKKRSAYERMPVLKGAVKFYDAKKTKKAMPIATITDAYSAYAVYPQAKPLIDQSTLVKVEGRITIHSQPESKTEGFVFVMPEAHPAVTGFEMMLRWLFPVYDTFNLYGRPRSLIADTLDTHGLMFAMPTQKRYGYLEIIDVAGLIHTDSSKDWSEREWRKRMKELTSRRMEMRRTALSREGSQRGGRKGPRTSLPSRPGDFRYDDNASVQSTPPTDRPNNQSTEPNFDTPQKAAAVPSAGLFSQPAHNSHARAASESVAFPSPSRSKRQKDSYMPSGLSTDYEAAEGSQQSNQRLPYRNGHPSIEAQQGRDSSDSDRRPIFRDTGDDIRHDLPSPAPMGPVTVPPAFAHQEGDRPQTRPHASPEMRRANSRMSTGTLSQMVDATGMRQVNGEAAAAGAIAAWNTRNGGRGEGGRISGVNEALQRREMSADQDVSSEEVIGGRPFGEGKTSNNQTKPNFLQPPPSQSRSSSEKSITRKALPSQTANDHRVESVSKQPTAGSSVIAASAGRVDDYQVPTNQEQHLLDQYDSHDRVGSDQNGTYLRDYTSFQHTTDLQDSIDAAMRPRTGVLKSVGDPTPPMPTREAPTIDFGPTVSLTPSAGGLLNRSDSPPPSQQRNQHDHGRDQSVQTNGRKSPHFGKSSPLEGSDGRPNTHSRSASYEKRTMAWQPGAVIGAGRQSPSPAITPEEFVQRRASASRTPSGYVPQRSRSSGYFGTDRSISGDWSKKKDNPPRPQSRGPSPTMNQPKDYSSRLSAHEQEHIAKMTGSPLISMPRKSENQAGLVGAIHAREQERKNMRDGVSGQMVQHAIAQRQQQAQAQVQAQIQAQQAAQVAYGYPQQHQGYQDGHGPLISAATWKPQNQPGQNAQWSVQGQSGDNFPQQNSSQYYNPSYMGYHGQQNGYQG
jgi:CCR4-NOT transcriptional complex subunit CAF120